eukprot:8332889-Heterocapsa_arctica.AAC.1
MASWKAHQGVATLSQDAAKAVMRKHGVIWRQLSDDVQDQYAQRARGAASRKRKVIEDQEH